MKLLIQSSGAASNAFRRIISDVCRSEINHLIKPETKSVWRSNGNTDKILNFSWQDVLQEANLHCPTITAALVGSTTTRKNEATLTKRIKIKTSVVPNIGAILGEMVFCRNNRHMKLFQELVGVQLWLAGCSREVIILLIC